MSITEEARAEARTRYIYSNSSTVNLISVADFVAGAEWLASRKPEAAPSDTDKAKAASDYSHQERFMKFRTPMERMSYEHHFKAGWDAALSRTSQPVQVEVTNESRNRAIEAVADLRGMATQGHMLLSSADIVDAALSAALGGGDHAE